MQIGWADPSAVVLTLVVPRMTIGRLLTLVQADATYWPMLRGDVPWDRDAPVQSWGGSTHDPGRGLTASMIEVLDTVPLDRIRARLRAQLIPRSVASLTLTAAAYLSPQPRVRCPVPGFSIYDDATLPVPDGSVALAGGGRRIIVPESTAGVLAGFADGAVHLIDDAVTTSEQLGADQVLRAVDDLLDVGLLEAAS
jgi:hypothetical protein